MCLMSCVSLRRADDHLQAAVGKRSRVDETGATGQSAPVDDGSTLHSVSVSQPSFNGDARSSTVLPLPDSAGVAPSFVRERQSTHRREHRQSAEQPRATTARDQPGSSTAPGATVSRSHTHHTDTSDRKRQSESHGAYRSDSRHGGDSRQRSSSRRREDSSQHRSSSQRPDASIHRMHEDSSHQESRPDSRGQQRGSDRLRGHQDRHIRPESRPDPRSSLDVRRYPDSHRGSSREGPRGHRDQDRDGQRNHRGDDGRWQDLSRSADRRHDVHRARESDTSRDKRKREEKEDKVHMSCAAVEVVCHCILHNFMLLLALTVAAITLHVALLHLSKHGLALLTSSGQNWSNFFPHSNECTCASCVT